METKTNLRKIYLYWSLHSNFSQSYTKNMDHHFFLQSVCVRIKSILSFVHADSNLSPESSSLLMTDFITCESGVTYQSYHCIHCDSRDAVFNFLRSFLHATKDSAIYFKKYPLYLKWSFILNLFKVQNSDPIILNSRT